MHACPQLPQNPQNAQVAQISDLAKKWAWPAKPALLGTSVKRLDGPDKVTGRAKYTFDINRPGMIYGKMVRSPHPHARIKRIDTSRAQKLNDVIAVVVGAAVARAAPPSSGRGR